MGHQNSARWSYGTHATKTSDIKNACDSEIRNNLTHFCHDIRLNYVFNDWEINQVALKLNLLQHDCTVFVSDFEAMQRIQK